MLNFDKAEEVVKTGSISYGTVVSWCGDKLQAITEQTKERRREWSRGIVVESDVGDSCFKSSS